MTISDNVELEGGALGWSASEHLLTMNVRVVDIEHDLASLFDGIDNRTTINYLLNGQPMTEITIPEGTRRIGARRFFGCRTLGSLTIPASVEEIGERAFEGVAEVHFLGATPATLASNEGFTAMGTYVVPAAALATYRAADKWHDFYQQIIPDNAQLAFDLTVTADRDRSAVVAAAGGEAQVEYATRLTLHGTINSYDIFAFRTKMPNLHYLDLTDVEIVGNPYEYYTGCYTEDHRLGHYAFVDMTKLVEVHLPKHITEIGRAAFAGCHNLRVLEMHEGIETVGYSAFAGCRSMQRFDFPDGIKSFSDHVFSGCSALEEINFGNGLLTLGSYQTYPWHSEEGHDWSGYVNNLRTVRFPETTEYIGYSAFYYAHNLKTVVLPKALKRIESETFYDCNSLENIVLPSGLQSIGRYAFHSCNSLRELRLPPMLEYIEDFAFDGCNNISNVYTYVVVPKDIAINQNTFSKTAYDQAQLHVPDFSRYAYMWNTQWGQFHDMTEFTDTYDTFYAKNTLTLDGSTGTIPGTPDATVHPTGGIEVSDDVNLELGEVDLNHNGTDGGSIIPDHEGNVSIKHLNVKISIEANRWYFFCFPFNVPLDDVKYGGEYVWRQYDGAARSRHEGGWRDLPADATELIAGRGYIFQGTNSSVLHLNIHNPEIRCGNASTDLNEYVGADTQPADANWNFVGNPYTSYYAVDEETYSAPITIWTGHGYEAYRPGDDDYEFAPYQAFFVQSGNGKNAVKFAADNREGYEQAQETQSNRRRARAQKKVNPNRLLVNLELGVQGDPSTGSGTSEYLDKTRVVFNDECSLDYESDCDAAKFFSEERRAELYTIGADGTQYAINERPEDGGYVDLGFVANQKGKYTISAQRMDVPMLLVDEVMETTFDLRNGAYEFSSAKGTFNKRFYLKRYEGITTSIKDLADQIGMTFSISDGSITVDGLDASTRVSLYNMAGQQIATQQGNGTLTAIPDTYVVSVGKLAAKVVIK